MNKLAWISWIIGALGLLLMTLGVVGFCVSMWGWSWVAGALITGALLFFVALIIEIIMELTK